jgi:hypothetical protein
MIWNLGEAKEKGSQGAAIVAHSWNPVVGGEAARLEGMEAQ